MPTGPPDSHLSTTEGPKATGSSDRPRSRGSKDDTSSTDLAVAAAETASGVSAPSGVAIPSGQLDTCATVPSMSSPYNAPTAPSAAPTSGQSSFRSNQPVAGNPTYVEGVDAPSAAVVAALGNDGSAGYIEENLAASGFLQPPGTEADDLLRVVAAVAAAAVGAEVPPPHVVQQQQELAASLAGANAAAAAVGVGIEPSSTAEEAEGALAEIAGSPEQDSSDVEGLFPVYLHQSASDDDFIDEPAPPAADYPLGSGVHFAEADRCRRLMGVQFRPNMLPLFRFARKGVCVRHNGDWTFVRATVRLDPSTGAPCDWDTGRVAPCPAASQHASVSAIGGALRSRLSRDGSSTGVVTTNAGASISSVSQPKSPTGPAADEEPVYLGIGLTVHRACIKLTGGQIGQYMAHAAAEAAAAEAAAAAAAPAPACSRGSGPVSRVSPANLPTRPTLSLTSACGSAAATVGNLPVGTASDALPGGSCTTEVEMSIALGVSANIGEPLPVAGEQGRIWASARCAGNRLFEKRNFAEAVTEYSRGIGDGEAHLATLPAPLPLSPGGSMEAAATTGRPTAGGSAPAPSPPLPSSPRQHLRARLTSELSRLYSNRSGALHALKQYLPALENAERSVELAPLSVRGYLRAGHVHRSLGQFPLAQEMYDAAARLGPGNRRVAEQRDANLTAAFLASRHAKGVQVVVDPERVMAVATQATDSGAVLFSEAPFASVLLRHHEFPALFHATSAFSPLAKRRGSMSSAGSAMGRGAVSAGVCACRCHGRAAGAGGQDSSPLDVQSAPASRKHSAEALVSSAPTSGAPAAGCSDTGGRSSLNQSHHDVAASAGDFAKPLVALEAAGKSAAGGRVAGRCEVCNCADAAAVPTPGQQIPAMIINGERPASAATAATVGLEYDSGLAAGYAVPVDVADEALLAAAHASEAACSHCLRCPADLAVVAEHASLAPPALRLLERKDTDYAFDPVPCTRGCGETYCSEPCRAAAWDHYHCMECPRAGKWRVGIALVTEAMRAGRVSSTAAVGRALTTVGGVGGASLTAASPMLGSASPSRRMTAGTAMGGLSVGPIGLGASLVGSPSGVAAPLTPTHSHAVAAAMLGGRSVGNRSATGHDLGAAMDPEGAVTVAEAAAERDALPIAPMLVPIVQLAIRTLARAATSSTNRKSVMAFLRSGALRPTPASGPRRADSAGVSATVPGPSVTVAGQSALGGMKLPDGGGSPSRRQSGGSAATTASANGPSPFAALGSTDVAAVGRLYKHLVLGFDSFERADFPQALFLRLTASLAERACRVQCSPLVSMADVLTMHAGLLADFCSGGMLPPPPPPGAAGSIGPPPVGPEETLRALEDGRRALLAAPLARVEALALLPVASCIRRLSGAGSSLSGPHGGAASSTPGTDQRRAHSGTRGADTAEVTPPDRRGSMPRFDSTPVSGDPPGGVAPLRSDARSADSGLNQSTPPLTVTASTGGPAAGVGLSEGSNTSVTVPTGTTPLGHATGNAGAGANTSATSVAAALSAHRDSPLPLPPLGRVASAVMAGVAQCGSQPSSRAASAGTGGGGGGATAGASATSAPGVMAATAPPAHPVAPVLAAAPQSGAAAAAAGGVAFVGFTVASNSDYCGSESGAFDASFGVGDATGSATGGGRGFAKSLTAPPVAAGAQIPSPQASASRSNASLPAVISVTPGPTVGVPGVKIFHSEGAGRGPGVVAPRPFYATGAAGAATAAVPHADVASPAVAGSACRQAVAGHGAYGGTPASEGPAPGASYSTTCMGSAADPTGLVELPGTPSGVPAVPALQQRPDPAALMPPNGGVAPSSAGGSAAPGAPSADVHRSGTSSRRRSTSRRKRKALVRLDDRAGCITEPVRVVVGPASVACGVVLYLDESADPTA